MKKNIRFLVMDVDGTLTDGKIYMGDSGEIFKAFNIKDGCGIKDILPQYGIIPMVITARKGKMVENRCLELGVKECYQGVKNKLEVLNNILTVYSHQEGICYSLQNVAYIGDDLPDIVCMKAIKNANGLIGCPLDSAKEVISTSDYVCNKKGGDGAVREFIEWIVDEL